MIKVEEFSDLVEHVRGLWNETSPNGFRLAVSKIYQVHRGIKWTLIAMLLQII